MLESLLIFRIKAFKTHLKHIRQFSVMWLQSLKELKEFKQTFWKNFKNWFLTSGAINAIVPNNCPWNSPAPVPFDANLAAAPKSAILNLWPVLSISKLAPVNSTIKILLVGFLLKAKGWTDIWHFSSLTSKLWNRLTFPTPVSRKSKNQGYGPITSLFCYAWMILHTAWGCLRDFEKLSNFQSRANTRDSGTMPGDGIMEENGDQKPQRLSLPAAPHEIWSYFIIKQPWVALRRLTEQLKVLLFQKELVKTNICHWYVATYINISPVHGQQ